MITLSASSAHALPLPDGAVHCVVTSPPYYSLRKYEGQQEIEWPTVSYAPMPGLEPVEVPAMVSALGLEPTPEAYIAHLVLCFREIRRVLRDDGVAWCVMGDSFFGDSMPRKKSAEAFSPSWNPADSRSRGGSRRSAASVSGLHPGDLMGIPHRLMFALQGDGWTCRNDVVWAKKSPMPESVSGWFWSRHRIKVKNLRGEKTQSFATGSGRNDGDNPGGGIDQKPWAEYKDCPGCPKCSPSGYVLRRGSWRHTRAHETVLQLTKGMGYFCDQEKVREKHSPMTTDTPQRKRMIAESKFSGEQEFYGHHRGKKGGVGERMLKLNLNGRNPRSVLTPRPESYPGAHYAVFPTTLIAPLIRASCPAKCCPECGAAWAAVVERTDIINLAMKGGRFDKNKSAEYGLGRTQQGERFISSAIGYRPTCSHNADPVPGTILDPYCGSGTVLAVARELGLNAIGLDLSPAYLDEHAKVRIGLTPSRALEELPLFKEDLWRTPPHWRPRPSFLEE